MYTFFEFELLRNLGTVIFSFGTSRSLISCFVNLYIVNNFVEYNDFFVSKFMHNLYFLSLKLSIKNQYLMLFSSFLLFVCTYTFDLVLFYKLDHGSSFKQRFLCITCNKDHFLSPT
jgi:hypothetical protein